MPLSFFILSAISFLFSPISFPPELLTVLPKLKYFSDGSCIYHSNYTPFTVRLVSHRYSLSIVSNLRRNRTPLSPIALKPKLYNTILRPSVFRKGNQPLASIYTPYSVMLFFERYSCWSVGKLWRNRTPSSPILFRPQN